MYTWGIDIQLQENFERIVTSDFLQFVKGLEGLLGITSYKKYSEALLFQSEFSRNNAFRKLSEKGFNCEKIKQAGIINMLEQPLRDIQGKVF